LAPPRPILGAGGKEILLSDRKCSALFAGIIGFVLGALAVKLAARSCPFFRTCCCSSEAGCCCGGEAECCCGGDDAGAEECCCCCEEAAESSSGEAEAPAE
jgi:hypothetical protein